jgi:hypothetical protein
VRKKRGERKDRRENAEQRLLFGNTKYCRA